VTEPPQTMYGLFRELADRPACALVRAADGPPHVVGPDGPGPSDWYHDVLAGVPARAGTTTRHALNTGEPSTTEELTAAVARRPPDCRVPTSVHHVPTPPVNAGGRLDRGLTAAGPGSGRDGT